MTRPLIVAVAHGLDLVTFLLALAAFGIGGESNGFMQMPSTSMAATPESSGSRVQVLPRWHSSRSCVAGHSFRLPWPGLPARLSIPSLS